VLNRINFINDDSIPKDIYEKAYNICKNIYENDIPFVALSIFLNAPLITGDKKLYNGLKKQNFPVFNLNEIKQLIEFE
jgi:predicted nucleic acid-binding protein